MLINVFNYRKILICFCTSKLVTFLSYHLLYSDVDDNNEKLSLHFSLDFHIELILVEMNHKLSCAEFSKHGYPYNPFYAPCGGRYLSFLFFSISFVTANKQQQHKQFEM